MLLSENDLSFLIDIVECIAERIWIISNNSIQDLLKELKKIEELQKYINERNVTQHD